jgi:hypothetical protein
MFAGFAGPGALQRLELEFTSLVTQARVYVAMVIIVEASRLQNAIDAASLMGRLQRDDIVRAGIIIRQRVIDVGLLVVEVLPNGLRLTRLPVDVRRPREEQDCMRATLFVSDVIRWLLDGLPVPRGHNVFAEFRTFVAEGDEIDIEDGEIVE